MSATQIVQLIKKSKQQKKITLNKIVSESGVAIRTANKIFAKKEVA